MTLISKAVLRSIAAAAALALGSFGAHADTWNYSQSFGAFGTVSGQFSGSDANNDGLIDETEASVLSMTYTGLGTLSFSQPQIQVQSLNWVVGDIGQLTNPTSGFDFLALPASGTGLGMNWQTGVNLGYANDGSTPAGSLVLFDAQSFVPAAQLDSTTWASVTQPVTPPVPEPESYLMMALGLAGIAAAKRRKLV